MQYQFGWPRLVVLFFLLIDNKGDLNNLHA